MNFEIPVETYIRLCGVSNYIRDDIPEDERQLLRCVRLEHKKGHSYALASNRKIAAIYYLGTTTEIDGSAHLSVDNNLLKQCETEKAFNSKLHIIALPELGVISLKTTMGFQVPQAGFFSLTTPLQSWQTWAPDEPVKASKGAMAWHMTDMQALNAASPSGRIAFPDLIDANKPVVLRDQHFPDWCGLFMGNLVNDKGQAYTVEAAELPKWWNV
ncbi:hypothetical protein P106B_55 [Rhizobium phage vB_RglS_P106B]|uniref:Uncharacterized protein n=1 Tax=Rhizobium phage vB_RglS_P106B TaxID=1458697 RepID=W6E9R4_9CAUD|nr:hypothetical protein P106B_55 [Rhizobium phage vB_RglS_P106B]AHJ10738.1 hypothetical protein P106B_55 [Rhizobium phage vB_RglS_P106B]